MNKRKCQVVMLPTNKKSDLRIVRGYDGNALCYDPLMTPTQIYNNKNHTLSYHHLYIISDEEMKEGDYVYVACSEVNVYEIRQITEYYNGQFLFDDKSQIDMDYCKKIIATTNTSLKINHFNKGVFKNLEYLLPQPSQEFIEAYVKSYNEGNPITEVIVEYEIICGRCYSNTDECWSAKECSRNTDFPDIVKLKVNSDNTINIKLIKDKWSKEEIIEFGLKCVNLGMDLNNNPNSFLNGLSGKDYYYKWIEENL